MAVPDHLGEGESLLFLILECKRSSRDSLLLAIIVFSPRSKSQCGDSSSC